MRSLSSLCLLWLCACSEQLPKETVPPVGIPTCSGMVQPFQLVAYLETDEPAREKWPFCVKLDDHIFTFRDGENALRRKALTREEIAAMKGELKDLGLFDLKTQPRSSGRSIVVRDGQTEHRVYDDGSRKFRFLFRELCKEWGIRGPLSTPAE